MAFENLLQREPWLLGDDYLAAGAPALSDLDECKAPAGSRVDELEPFGVLTRFNEFSRVSIPLAS